MPRAFIGLWVEVVRLARATAHLHNPRAKSDGSHPVRLPHTKLPYYKLHEHYHGHLSI